MKRIFPTVQNTMFLQKGEVTMKKSISELGIYGVYLGDGGKDRTPIINEYAGYLLRTKPRDVDEGGVATGYSVLNSVVLR